MSGPGHGVGASGHGLTGIADAGAFLTRLTRLDPGALVRLRPLGDTGRTSLWARVPWQVLVGRTVAGTAPGDVTVSAGELLAELRAGRQALPVRRDADWRQALPPSAGRVVESVPAEELRRLAAAAADALRAAAAAAPAVGERRVRDALLDHLAIVVSGPPGTGPARVEVPQRLVQAVVRMGFLGPRSDAAPARSGQTVPDVVHVLFIRNWVGLSAPFGVAWMRSVDNLALTPV
ncbi:MAG TPA: hypothetical protein VF174_15115 [Micromonosporaceae bacterium]